MTDKKKERTFSTAIGAKSKKRPGRYRDEQLPGLYLQVTPGGGRSWILRYRDPAGRVSKSGHPRERWLGLGPASVVGLADARERARRARLLLLDGIDPLEARRAAKREAATAAARHLTFEEASRTYFRQKADKWKNRKAAAQFLSTLQDYAFPIIGEMAVADIETEDILAVLEQHHPKYPDRTLWSAIPETASRVRGRIEKILKWATARKHREGDNPASWDLLKEVLPARSQVAQVEHFRALPYEELPAFMADLRKRQGVAARALEFTILCASRTGETIGAVWSEIDLDKKLWTIPGRRMKSGREHQVPLSDRAVEVLRKLPREKGNPFVFISTSRGGAGLSNMAMSQTLKRMSVTETVHGFRSSFRDWAGDCTGFPRDVAEAALAHVLSDKTEAAYRRATALAKRRKLMDAWAEYAASNPARGGKVVPLRRAAE